MDLRKILLITIFASGFVVLATHHEETNLKYHDWENSPKSKGCEFCFDYFQTGHGPYDVLWKLGSEIWPNISTNRLTVMLMNPERLKVAEYFFKDYCKKFCGELTQEEDEYFPCQ